ncbi:hypothetical protein E2C01_049266 [Portunus trituberculatus]|uniref:Uncharacterized protein n=1 Tax=Portunus trituberculatus TaxID=210409 RepID=A0A5B7GDH1_PORTR|nr:hypothetical protein [Portunus trituberculatus]
MGKTGWVTSRRLRAEGGEAKNNDRRPPSRTLQNQARGLAILGSERKEKESWIFSTRSAADDEAPLIFPSQRLPFTSHGNVKNYQDKAASRKRLARYSRDTVVTASLSVLSANLFWL